MSDQEKESREQSNFENRKRFVEKNTNDYVQDLKQGQSNILVAVRCRPLLKKEIEINPKKIVKIIDEKVIVLLDPLEDDNQRQRNREKQFAFDYAFDEDASNYDVYDRTTSFLLKGVVEGYNATVFAYGATGAGKTYTMIGTEQNPGIMWLAIRDLFQKVNQMTDFEFKIRASFLEIYNENIKDLANPSQELLEIREDYKGVTVSGLSEIQVNSTEEIMKILQVSNANRSTEATESNETSSRSHAVLQVMLEKRDKAGGTSDQIVTGKLSLIDLAGSERASATQNKGLRLIEGANINRSLLSLGNCINALCEQSQTGDKNKFIPYRDSKLTRLLKDSLGGNCRTVMIVNINPFFNSFEDTKNALKYANRAKNIKIKLERNVLKVDYHISKYASIIQSLKHEISELRKEISKVQINYTSGLMDKLINELNNHFKEEMQIKQKINEIEQTIDKQTESLINKQSILENAEQSNKNKKDGNYQSKEQTQEINKIKEDMDLTRQSIKRLESQKQDQFYQLKKAKKSRNDLQNKWGQHQLKEHELMQLQAIFKSNVLSVENQEFKRRGFQLEVHIKQKESYAQSLERQMQLRDQLITNMDEILKQHKVKKNAETKKIQKQLLDIDSIANQTPLRARQILNNQINAGKILHSTKPALQIKSNQIVIQASAPKKLRPQEEQKLPQIIHKKPKQEQMKIETDNINLQIQSAQIEKENSIASESTQTEIQNEFKADQSARLKAEHKLNLSQKIPQIPKQQKPTSQTPRPIIGKNVAKRIEQSPYVIGQFSNLTKGLQSMKIEKHFQGKTKKKVKEDKIKYGPLIRGYTNI